MKKMLAIGLVSALGITSLVMSALGQTMNPRDPGQNSRADFIPSFSAYGQYGVQSQSMGEVDKLAQQLAKTKGEGERETLRTKLSDLLEKQFDEGQKRHQAESEALEAQVKRLKELISLRNENRKEIINRRLEQVVREAQGLGWIGGSRPTTVRPGQ
jgi:hypothetical protein